MRLRRIIAFDLDWRVHLFVQLSIFLSQIPAVSKHANKTGHHPLWNEVRFIDRDSHWYARRVKKAILIRLHPDNINRDNGFEMKFLKRGYQRSRNTTGDRYISEPPREQLQMGPVGKQLHSGAMRIERHQSQSTIVIPMVTHNQPTSSPDED